MVEPGNTPELHEIYRLTRENNQMLHSMRRTAFWGGLLRFLMYALALGVPVWLYFIYLAPIVKQMDATLSAATGKQVQLEGQIGQWQQMYEQYKAKYFGGGATSTPTQ